MQNNTLVAVAGGSADGTAGLKENSSFTALRREIERFANTIFSSHSQQRDFWLGKGADSRSKTVVRPQVGQRFFRYAILNTDDIQDAQAKVAEYRKAFAASEKNKVAAIRK